ncbi:MAG: DNA-directed RNA polymerase subunit beta' [Paludibacteraceae bacterium]|nr:DNA-directed RNA polymerase subunit beta' [Paludibacteraceae bacterium]
MAFKQENKRTGFSKISIGLASPDEIMALSSGEVLKPETINYRTYKPERDGLFCERIFGPTKDYECHCGKYKRIRYKGIVCERCGVEVTEKKVRRERMGHIKLVVPVAHIWYLRSLPSKMAALLGIPTKKLDAVIYYEKYLVVRAGALDGVEIGEKHETDKNRIPIEDRMLLDEEQYEQVRNLIPEGNDQLEATDPQKVIVKMGAEAIYDLLASTDLDQLSYELRATADKSASVQRKQEALKRLQIVEAFRASKGKNRPEWMILQAIPVTPPELRPLVPLDGGRFATSDLNDLYRRVIIRNNRLKRLIEIKAPDVILRNEKRMLQEAVDSLFDNSRKTTAMKSEANRPLKSLSDSLKGKQGRFRQNLLGKRVDYSARSVIVVGPELKMHECGLPKEMAAELYKPFIIRKLIERGIVKTVKSAKKIIDRRDPVIYEILEHVMEGHPVLLNRAPTLHRHGILAFQPRMIEGKAIQLHPLSCAGFNADFDGDQMAVHLPLSNEAILEAQLLMLGSHNILDPANGNPITVPSQDMILGLYYITKEREGVKGEGLTFYSSEEAMIALNESRVDIHARVNVRVKDIVDGAPVEHIIQTTPGRVIVNNYMPEEIGFQNVLMKKSAVKAIISKVIKTCGVARTARFLDDIKDLGYYRAFRGGLSFNLNDILIPTEKKDLIKQGNEKVDNIMALYSLGEISDDQRYRETVDTWHDIDKKMTAILMDHMKNADQGFNSVYMMMDSGARGDEKQIKQLAGIRGIMGKPQKAGSVDARQEIENPVLSNFKEGMSVLEYFISTHGARKGLADTALKTADAGYLTRRLVDVSHDVIINEEDCGTLRGLTAHAIKDSYGNIQASLTSRILGRVSVHDILDNEGKLIVAAGEEIREAHCEAIEAAGIEEVVIRSVLTCESKKGVCAKCYGRNLATRMMVQRGEAVGVIAAQAIGEPGTQLTLRTFHAGGLAGSTGGSQSTYALARDGVVEIEDLRTITTESGEVIVVSRLNELQLKDEKTGVVLSSFQIPYGSKLYIKPGEKYPKGTNVCEWDQYQTSLVIEQDGRIRYEDVIEGVTCKTETDEQTGKREVYITDTKDKTKMPQAHIVDKDGNVLHTYNLPVKANLIHADGKEVKIGDTLFSMPRFSNSGGDITSGLPRITELFEARNPSNPAVVAEIDGEVSFGKIKRGNRELFVTSKLGEQKAYLIPLTKQILVQEGDYVRAGVALSDGAITPEDILSIQGPTAVQEYIVNEAQAVYRMQHVEINDKHFEIIVRQMMRKVEIIEAGDTRFLEGDIVDKLDFLEENDRIWGRKVVTDAGDSESLHEGQIITARRLHDENSSLRRRDKKLVQAREAECATAKQILQGITRAALGTKSFMSAASFQETTKVLNEAAIRGKVDYLEGMKENVICGNLIPAGTGLREFARLTVHNQEEYAAIQAAREAAEAALNGEDDE